jgi:hypothetical protein
MSKHFRSRLARLGIGWSHAAELLNVSEEQIEEWRSLDVPVPDGTVPRLVSLAEADFYRRTGDGPVAWSRVER